MSTICQIVHQALQSGYLTLEAENQLRQLLEANYNLRDLDALTRLQQAVTVGQIEQQSKLAKAYARS